MYAVHHTDEFERTTAKLLSPQERRYMAVVYKRVAAGTLRGRCLAIPWLWELKLDGKRLYYILQEQTVVFIRSSNKNNQRETIESIRAHKAQWLAEVRAFMRRV